jgi:aspartate kinase
MDLVVQKYGGSSLATPEDIKRIARSVVEEHRKGNQMVVVVSAMGDTTDHLVELAKAVSQNPPEREMDMLLSVGERTSIALLAMAISDLGCQAISYTGSQVGIITDDRHTEARILEVRALRVREALEGGKIVIIAGFQGVSINKEITTLGRGGTDTTALAVAAALQADRCEIMKDVDGIYIAEPRLVPQPKLNPQISYDEMIEMANMGAGVLKTESVEIARHYRVKVAVGSSFSGKIGTIITDQSHNSSAISGIVGQKKMAYLKLNTADAAQKYQLNQRMAARRIKVQSYLMQPEYLEIVFQQRFLAEVKAFLSEMCNTESGAGFSSRDNIGIIGIIGTGLNFNSDTALQIFQTLERLGIDPKMLQVSELKISWMMPEEKIDDAVKLLYRELVEKVGVSSAY